MTSFVSSATFRATKSKKNIDLFRIVHSFLNLQYAYQVLAQTKYLNINELTWGGSKVETR